jgi:hypothetical protein
LQPAAQPNRQGRQKQQHAERPKPGVALLIDGLFIQVKGMPRRSKIRPSIGNPAASTSGRTMRALILCE